MITDLDELFPEESGFEITNKDDGKKYKVVYFIPVGVALFILENLDLIKNVISTKGKKIKITKESTEFMLKILELICKEQHEFMTMEWIGKNISAPRIGFIMSELVILLLGYLTSSGLMGVVEGKTEQILKRLNLVD